MNTINHNLTNAVKTISLKVTTKVLKQSQAKNINQQQIAVIPAFLGVDKSNMKELEIQGSIKLTLGDTSAIWRSHNLHNTHFDNLFSFLSHYPDTEFQFDYRVIPANK